VSGGGNHLGNLVLACGTCNGDEKREEEWREFLRRKTAGDPALFAEREQVILGWFQLWPRATSREEPEVAGVRKDLEALIEQFGKKCAELRTIVNATTNRAELRRVHSELTASAGRADAQAAR
jgi:hypothetical protein